MGMTRGLLHLCLLVITSGVLVCCAGSASMVEGEDRLTRSQDPRSPFPYHSEDVRYSNPAGGVELAGTLTIPEGTGPFPAAVLISGSGQQDRNCEIFDHRLFLVLADHLSRRGIAVLRVDDRGVGGSTDIGPPGESTSFDFAGDVESGVSYLLGRSEIRADSVGLIGHSEGGMIAPIVAARDERIAFIVLLAGPGMPIDQLLLIQNESMMRSGGASEDVITQAADDERKIFDLLLDDSVPADQATEQLIVMLRGSPLITAEAADDRELELRAFVDKIDTPWFRAFLAYDPGPTLRRVRCPVLAINGTLDLQVTVENLDWISSSLEAGGNPDFTIMPMQGLNHPLQRCRTGSIEEYALIDETMSPEVLDAVGAWITDRHRASIGSEVR